jgi:hypothetical protein
MASAAVALGLTVTIVGIVGAAGVATAVCAKAGSVAANTIANSVFFIFVCSGILTSILILLFGSCYLIRQ